jgi:hypothetical protein
MKSNRERQLAQKQCAGFRPYETRIFVRGMPQLQTNAPPETQTAQPHIWALVERWLCIRESIDAYALRSARRTGAPSLSRGY